MIKFVKKYGGWSAVILILCLALYLRVYDLTVDPPLVIGTFSQDLATDPYHITSFAANKANFGAWELFPYPEWQVFKVSLPSVISYLLFSIGNTNSFWTHLAGVIPSFIGILLLLWGIASGERTGRWQPVLAAAIFLGTNFALVTYNRAPFLETGVIFYFSLIVLLYKKNGNNIANLLIITLLTLLACFTGRLFALTADIAILANLVFGLEKDRFKKVGWMTAGGFLFAVVLLLLLYGNRIGAYFEYLAERSDTSRGNLFILNGIGDFIKVLFSYGSESRLFKDSPFLFIAGYATLITAILCFRNCYDWFRKNLFLRFSLYWTLTMFVLFFPFNYRPLRYSLLLYLPLVLVMAALSDVREIRRKDCSDTKSIWAAGVLFFLNFFFLIHLVIDFFLYGSYPAEPLTVYAYMFFPAVILTIIMISNPVRRRFTRLVKNTGIVLIILALCSLAYQVTTYRQWINHSHRSTEDASKDLADILGKGAVIAGPYAPRLTLGSKHKHFIYYFGLPRPDTSIFKTFPISHLAVGKRNLEAAIRDFPDVKNATIIADYLIRGRTVMILKMPQKPAGYEPSTYELAEECHKRGDTDSALILNDAFRQRHPSNKAALKQLFRISIRRDDTDNCISALNELFYRYPKNVDVQFFCALRYKFLGIILKRPDLISVSKKALARAKWMYYGLENHLQRLYDETT